MIHPLRAGVPALTVAVILTVGATLTMPAAHADNKRLNNSVVLNVYTVQQQAGCTNDVTINPQLQLAAQWHADDMMNNRNLDGEIGSDGSTRQDRANAAGYHGKVAETVAIKPALAISGMDILNQWYYNPDSKAIMSDCANNQMGVWSENSPDRSVVVAVYGQPQQPQQPQQPAPPRQAPPSAQPAQSLQPTQSLCCGGCLIADAGQPTNCASVSTMMDPFPDYDASDELEFGLRWLPWILRGVYPPPAYPQQ
jgi:Cysteine-rich secretory protein family